MVLSVRYLSGAVPVNTEADMTSTEMTTSPQGIANRLHYRLSERYPLGTLEVAPNQAGDAIKVTLHGKDGKADEQTFSYAELKAAQDPLNVVLPRLKTAEELIPVNKETRRMNLAGKVIEVSKRAADKEGNLIDPVVVTGDQKLFGADSAPDGAVTEGITDSVDPGEAVAPTPNASSDTTGAIVESDGDDPAVRSRTRAADKQADAAAATVVKEEGAAGTSTGTTSADGSNADSAAVKKTTDDAKKK